MSLLDKVKNMFIEEYEEDEPIKKEVIQVKIPTPVEEKKEEEKEEEKIVEKKPTLPTFFDDSDFEEFEKPKEEKPKITKIEPTYKEEKQVKVNISGYKGKKEELKKNFKPTPIISPVYGVLDKNYKKGEITSKKKAIATSIHSDYNSISVDDIRKKAYGTLEDELEKTLIDKETLMYTSPQKEKEEPVIEQAPIVSEEPIDIFAELEKADALDQLLNSYDFSEDKPLNDKDLNKDYDKYEKELNITKELNDSDLFNLIDSMYDKKDGE
ncbi:MAG: hypothetical protein RSB77_05680 [Bacilli bacterium]